MSKLISLLFLGLSVFLSITNASRPQKNPIPVRPTIPATVAGTCPVPSEEMLKCVRQWACQYIIRLDLRCLLNLNGNPLLGGLLGGPPSPVDAASGGILGGILQG